MKASILYFPNESKKNSKTGKIPLYMRICINRTKAESRLNAEIAKPDLLKWDPITMRLMERNSSINHQLNRFDQKFNDFLILNATCLPNFTASIIKDYVIGTRNKDQMNILQFIDNYFENTIAKNCNIKEGTVKVYRRAINHFVKFLEIKKQKALMLENLDYTLANEFKNYLVNTDRSINKSGMTEVSAATVIKKFRTIFSQAVNQDMLKKNPFKTVKIKTKSPRKDRLTIYQVNQLWKLDLTDLPYQEVYRDIFMFSIFTGLAYRDTMSLTWANLEKRNCGNIKLTINRTKSEIITESFLTSYAIRIIKKYQQKDEIEILGKVLPSRSNKEINLQLKLIASLASIPIPLSTHTARHTFRQLLSEARIADYGVIKRMMGQSRKGDIDEVYYEVTENGLMDAKIKFQDFLDNNLLK